MGLATTYIVAMFAIFMSLLSFILSSYGGQVTTRSSSHQKDDVGLKGTVSQRILSQDISQGHTKKRCFIATVRGLGKSTRKLATPGHKYLQYSSFPLGFRFDGV
jgi:hypothetical protein